MDDQHIVTSFDEELNGGAMLMISYRLSKAHILCNVGRSPQRPSMFF